MALLKNKRAAGLYGNLVQEDDRCPSLWEKFSFEAGVLSGKEFRFVEATESDFNSNADS